MIRFQKDPPADPGGARIRVFGQALALRALYMRTKGSLMLTAFVLIQAEPAKIAQIAQAVANLPNVAEVYSVTGDVDIIAVLRLAEYEQLAEVVPESLARIDGITRTNTILAFRRYSAQDLKAAWDMGVA